MLRLPFDVVTVDYESEYNNRLRVLDYGTMAARWRTASEIYRRTAKAELDQPYGPGERQRYDLFVGDESSSHTVVYIHGGYWQWGNRSLYSFLARPLTANGLNVVLPSYSLCPNCTVMDIVGELRQCLVILWKRMGICPLVVGHSAGGHLTAAMLATDWSAIDDVPSDLVRTGIAVSGVFDLEPLVATTINDALGLDRHSARLASPRYWGPSATGVSLTAAVGAHESLEMKRQSRDIAREWRFSGAQTDYVEVEGANHFTILDDLSTPGSPLFDRVVCAARNLSDS